MRSRQAPRDKGTLDMVHGMAVPRDAPHLGGYVPGGDPGTQFPTLWKWMIDAHEVRTILDVGAGDGTAMETMEALGATTLGIDGVDTGNPHIVVHDYETGPFPNNVDEFLNPCDMVWCCEFVEHIEERYVPNFLRTFEEGAGRFILMTHGEPGQPGHHHVNNQTADYWKGALAAIGFEFDEQTTALARGMASANTDPYNHFRRSGLVFRRRA